MGNRSNFLAGSSESHGLTRREMMHGLIDACARRLRNEGALRSWTQEPTTTNAAQVGPYDSAILPRGIRSRFIDSGNGLRTHVLEAGFGANERPCVVLLPISPD